MRRRDVVLETAPLALLQLPGRVGLHADIGDELLDGRADAAALDDDGPWYYSRPGLLHGDDVGAGLLAPGTRRGIFRSVGREKADRVLGGRAAEEEVGVRRAQKVVPAQVDRVGREER